MTAVPGIDSQIGIAVYSTDSAGIGGRIRGSPDDFAVSETISEGAAASIAQEGGYAVYRLKKREIDTAHAVSDIRRRTGLRLRALGLKDASAATEQYLCAEGRGRSVEGLSAPRYELARLGFVKRPLSKRDMTGNRFEITIRGHSGDPGAFAGQDRVLNFYGYQRFGSSRPVTHLVGRALVRRDFEGAVDLILSYVSPHDSPERAELRRRLSDRASLAGLLGSLPAGMDVERAVAGAVAEHGDCLRAVRAVPLQLRRFYVQAYQSYVFNRSLSAAFEAGEELFAASDGDVCYDARDDIGRFTGAPGQRLALPFVGYSYYAKTRFHPYISGVLEEEGAAPRDFFIKELQEASGEGGFRQAAVRCRGYSARGGTVAFDLSRGSFATVLLREVMKPADPVAAGF